MDEKKFDRLGSLRKPVLGKTDGTAVFRHNRGEPEAMSAPERVVFRGADGNDINVDIISKEKIGGGNNGTIYRARVRFLDVAYPKEGLFVLKQFFNPPDDTINAKRNHSRLVEAGIKTWTTYMVSKDKATILMNDGEMEGVFLVSWSDSKSQKYLRGLPDLEISNLKEALAEGFKSCEKATQNHLWIQDDTWMGELSLTTNSTAKIRFIVGDLDCIDTGTNRHALALAHRNKSSFIDAVHYTIHNVVSNKSALEECMIILDQSSQSLIKEIEELEQKSLRSE